MQKILTFVLLLLPIIAHSHTTHGTDQEKTICRFAPENDLQIPVNSFLANSEITEERFNEILDQIYKIYEPEFAALGKTFKITKAWSSPAVNALAIQNGKLATITMFGGLARHPKTTEDGFALVACHELGHHLGGAPKKVSNSKKRWASNEGQSDYFATLKCARRIWGSLESNKEFQLDSVAEDKCKEAFPENPDEQSLCRRSAAAGMSLAQVLADIRKRKEDPSFSSPDSAEVEKTYDGHPKAQCRLDTYFAGAICNADKNKGLDDNDPDKGACSRKYGNSDGVRPLCWYKP